MNLGGFVKPFTKALKKPINAISPGNLLGDIGKGLFGGMSGSGNDGMDALIKYLSGLEKKRQQELDAIGPAPTVEAVPDLESTRLKKLKALRYGMMSTIKTMPGIMGGSPTLSNQSAYSTGTRINPYMPIAR